MQCTDGTKCGKMCFSVSQASIVDVRPSSQMVFSVGYMVTSVAKRK
jgi:hypothetical protein